jgi:hypothetical protein
MTDRAPWPGRGTRVAQRDRGRRADQRMAARASASKRPRKPPSRRNVTAAGKVRDSPGVLSSAMHRLSIVMVVFTVLVAACGNGGRDLSSGHHDSTATGTPPPAATPATTASGQSASEPPARARLPSSAERRRLRSIAGSVERAVALFDTSVRACPKATRGGCVDRAWAVLVVDLDWPPYYLRRFAARTRGCQLLAVAVQGVNSFNLAARQVDYGDPGEYATPTRRRGYLVLVDGLRPVPDELRAAASHCR